MRTLPFPLAGAGLIAGLALLLAGSNAHAATIPATQATALDGHTVSLPADLPAATVLILGFSRHSVDATTAWQKPTRAQLAHAPSITFYDMAMLAAVPRFARGLVLRSVRKAVPDILKPNFLPLTEQETEWKQAVGFDPSHEDAAYVVLVDRKGAIQWSTHQPFTPALFAQLTEATQSLSAPPLKGTAITSR